MRPCGPLSARSTAAGRCLRVGVDGKAEEDELQQRNADHHPEGQAVAAHLDEFLDDHGPETAAEENGCAIHAGIIVLRFVHEVDEHVLQSGVDPVAIRTGSCETERWPAPERAASSPLTCSAAAERHGLLDTGQAAQVLRRACSRSGPLTDQVVRCAWPMTSATVPWASRLP